MKENFLLFPENPPSTWIRSLELGGYEWTTEVPLDLSNQGPSACTGAIVSIQDDPTSAWALCRRLRRRDDPIEPLLLVLGGNQLDILQNQSDLFDDFIIAPAHPFELEARLGHALWRGGRGARPELVEYGALRLNTETYQAQISGRPLDLTYMEYALLKHLASSPGRVFSREVLLSEVWGYEYHGGARTVDVHIRRLRAKLGHDHAQLIQTVRSVGYKLGQGRWA